MRTFLLTTLALLAMVRTRPWEPLLIVFAIVLANAGLVTVLLINEGAAQGELLQSKQSLLTSSLITPADNKAYFTKEQYSLLRRNGFTQLIAFAARDITLTCDRQAQENKSIAKVTLLGIDSQPLLGSRYRGLSAPDLSLFLNSVSTSPEPPKNNTHSSGARVFSPPLTRTSLSNPPLSSPPLSRQAGPDVFSVKGLIHPATSTKLACHNRHMPSKEASSGNNDMPLLWPAKITASVTNLVPQNTVVISIEDFYKGGVRIEGSAVSEQLQLKGFIALTALNNQDISLMETLLGIPVSLKRSDAMNDTGSLPDSFRLNLWAMSALMGVVALFIVLNALNLMYRTRLPNIIRFRQLGISASILTRALFAELLLYCLISIPIGMFMGFQAASFLSPVISGTFASLFDAVFINPDINLLSLFGLALLVTFLSLALFACIPVSMLSRALTVNHAKSTKRVSLLFVLLTTLLTLLLLFAVEQYVASTASALIFVALLLLSSCALVLLWLPVFARAMTRVVPKKWPMFHYVIANMHAISGKTRLAVCAFFIALTANIGMNTMTDSFRNATEQWLAQRLYAPFYLYTDQLLSSVNLSPSIATTPLLKVQGEVTGVSSRLDNALRVQDAPSKISISSYPIHDAGKHALVFDSLLHSSTTSTSQSSAQWNNQLDTLWQKFVDGEGVFINQQLAYENDIQLGDILTVSNITLGQSGNATVNAQISQSELQKSLAVFSDVPTWKVLGIYPDYGNLNGQILVPLPFFATQDDTVKNALFSGVMALYPKAQTIKVEKKSAANKNDNDVERSEGVPAFVKANSLEFKAQVEKALNEQPHMQGKYTLYAKQDLLDVSMQTFDRTFVLTDGLNITTLLVAGIAFAVSLTVLTLGSAAQLSVLRAIGISQIKVKFALFMQYMLLCFVSALLAIPFGIYLAYVFINLVNRHAFNWTYPLAIDLPVIASSVGWSLLIVSLVLMLPLGKLRPKIDLRQEVQL